MTVCHRIPARQVRCEVELVLSDLSSTLAPRADREAVRPEPLPGIFL